MPRIDLDLSGLGAERKSLQGLIAQQRSLDLEIANAQASLDAATRAGESPNATVPLQERIRQANAQRAVFKAQQRELASRIDAIANGLSQQQDPSHLVESMDGQWSPGERAANLYSQRLLLVGDQEGI